MIKGIDVSKWQQQIDWTAVKGAGKSFSMVRASYGGNTLDSYFQNNIAHMKAAGIPAGAYHYCMAKTKEEAAQEAAFFIDAISGQTLEYPAALDLEDGSLVPLGRDAITEIAQVFLSALQEAGYYPMLYANRTWLTHYLDMARLERYDLWLAEYRSQYTYEGKVDMWQYSSAGNVAGIKGHVDLDISYRDYPKIIREGGWNHLEKEPELTVTEAKRIIQEACGFDNNTMLYLEFYRYSGSMLTRLAQAIEKPAE